MHLPPCAYAIGKDDEVVALSRRIDDVHWQSAPRPSNKKTRFHREPESFNQGFAKAVKNGVLLEWLQRTKDT